MQSTDDLSVQPTASRFSSPISFAPLSPLMDDAMEDIAQRPEVQRRLLLDCANRVKNGIFVYTILWIAIGVASGFAHDQPTFWLVNIGIFSVNAVLRLWLHMNLARLAQTRLETAKALFAGLLFLNVLHWGVLTSLCVLMPALHDLQLPMLLSASGIAASGASVLAIHRLLRVLSPIAVVAPVVIGLLVQPSTANTLVAVLCIIMVVYFIGTARVLYNDYWAALSNSLLLEQRARQLEELSNTDTLTRLRNRLYFDVNFATEWKRASRHRWPLAVLVIDLDHFKDINDHHGHAFGDLCLQTVARLLQAEVQRAGDIVARWGGEEFIILLTQTGPDAATAVAGRLLKAMSEYTLYNGEQGVPVTGSIGVASAVPSGADQGYQLINQADQALYQAKERGRNQVVVFDPASAQGVDEDRPASMTGEPR